MSLYETSNVQVSLCEISTVQVSLCEISNVQVSLHETSTVQVSLCKKSSDHVWLKSYTTVRVCENSDYNVLLYEKSDARYDYVTSPVCFCEYVGQRNVSGRTKWKNKEKKNDFSIEPDMVYGNCALFCQSSIDRTRQVWNLSTVNLCLLQHVLKWKEPLL